MAVRIEKLQSDTPYAAPSKQRAGVIDGVHTQVVIQEYADRSFVLVTETGKIGTVIQASVPTQSSPHAPLTAPVDDGFDFDADLHDKGSGGPEMDGLPSANILQTALMGTPPPGYAAVYSLYVNSLHQALRSSAAPSTGAPEEDAQRDARPVIVALGLTPKPVANSNGVQSDSQSQDLLGEEVEGVAEAEGPRFRGVLALVKECLSLGT
ncbi:unnamed protein product [Jaminaea pallidilutea]